MRQNQVTSSTDLTLNDYQDASARRSRIFDDSDAEIEHWISGLLQAVNNLADLTVRHKKPFGTREVGAEAGDALFALARALDFYGLSLSDIAEDSIP